MNFDKQQFAADDPRVTAYALNEMTRPECAEFEMQLARSSELRAEVNEIEEMAATLRRELGNEMIPPAITPLTLANRSNLVPLPQPRRLFAASIAVAASIALVIGWRFHRHSENPARIPASGESGRGFTQTTIHSPMSLRDVATVAYESRMPLVERPDTDEGTTVIRPIGPLQFHYAAHGVPRADPIRLSDVRRLNFNVGYELRF